MDLRAQASHFYALGARVMDLFEDDDIVDVLIEVRLTWSNQCCAKNSRRFEDVLYKLLTMPTIPQVL